MAILSLPPFNWKTQSSAAEFEPQKLSLVQHLGVANFGIDNVDVLLIIDFILLTI